MEQIRITEAPAPQEMPHTTEETRSPQNETDVVDKPVTKEQILAEYDNLRKALKHTVARGQLMDTWSHCEGWSVNKIYHLIQNERPSVTNAPFTRTKVAPVLKVQDEINGLHSEIVGLAQKALDNAIRIGELLTAKKAELAHGEFLPWLKANVNFGPDAAERYRIVYARRDELPRKECKTLTQALKLLKKSDDLAVSPDPAVKRSSKSAEEKKFEAEAAEKEKEQLLRNIGIVDTPKAEDELDDERQKMLEDFYRLLEERLSGKWVNYRGLLVELAGMIEEEIKKLDGKQ